MIPQFNGPIHWTFQNVYILSAPLFKFNIIMTTTTTYKVLSNLSPYLACFYNTLLATWTELIFHVYRGSESSVLVSLQV